MGTVYNDTTKETYTLTPNIPLILGRKDVDTADQRVSRAHVQILLLDDQRCFVKSLSRNASTLDNAVLPKKLNDRGEEEGAEIEAFDNQLIHLLVGNLYPFRLNLPKSATSPTPRKPFQHNSIEDSDNRHGSADAVLSMNEEIHSVDSDTSTSNISTESSLLGNEEWSDE